MKYKQLFLCPTGVHVFAFRPLSGKQKKTNSLRSLRLSGDYKLSNYNTIPYLRIRVLRVLCSNHLCGRDRFIPHLLHMPVIHEYDTGNFAFVK